MRRTFFIIFIVLFFGNILQAQNDPQQATFPIKTDESFGDKLRSTWDKIRKNKDDEKNDSVRILTDSIANLTDSIAKLNKSLDCLQKQQQQQQQRVNPESQQKTMDSLRIEIRRLNTVIDSQIVKAFGNRLKNDEVNNFFCFSVMESPLYYNYDKQRIEQSLMTARAMGYDRKSHKYNWIYNVYDDLLNNYELYNNELIENINAIIEQFSYVKPNKEFELRLFEDRLAKSKYYQIRGKGKYGTYKHIFYLDFQIEQLRNLFRNDANFKKEKFIEIRKTL